MKPVHKHHRRGTTLALWLIVGVAIVGVGSLAVDGARVKMVENQLKTGVDAAALAGAAKLKDGIQPAINAAIAAAGKNKVDGNTLVITAADVQLGTWDPDDRKFHALSGAARLGATAVRVKARRDGVPTTLARLFGVTSVNREEEAVATRGIVNRHYISGRACPWLAGMPNGSRVTAYGGNPQHSYAPSCSPYLLNVNVSSGSVIQFAGVSGFTRYSGSDPVSSEGQLDWIVSQQPDNGINTTHGPINALGGIFLDNRRPNQWALQPVLDFSTAQKRNFTTLSPKLKQVFFIGDGLNDNGVLQSFVAPPGATRLYIGVIDEKGWWHDQTDQYEFITIDGGVQLVK